VNKRRGSAFALWQLLPGAASLAGDPGGVYRGGMRHSGVTGYARRSGDCDAVRMDRRAHLDEEKLSNQCLSVEPEYKGRRCVAALRSTTSGASAGDLEQAMPPPARARGRLQIRGWMPQETHGGRLPEVRAVNPTASCGSYLLLDREVVSSQNVRRQSPVWGGPRKPQFNVGSAL
jgi:hypothetical protein